MKSIRLILFSLIVIVCPFLVRAQNNVANQKIQLIKQAIENKSFVFRPEFARVSTGKEIRIDPELNYQLNFDGSLLDSYLPNADQNGLVVYTTEGIGAFFNTNNFDYEMKRKAKGYSIVFKMKKTLGTTRVAIDVTENGKYSTVRLTNISNYIQAVTYTGTIAPLKITDNSNAVAQSN